jgi:hypothetical protein
MSDVLVRFEFITDNAGERRKAEQFVLDQVRKALGLGKEATKRKGGGVENKINPVNKFLRQNIKFCK